jgi:hypothetical protein
MVVTEYMMPSAVPKGRPTSHVDRIGFRPTGCLNKDEGQNECEGPEFDPAWLKRSENQGSDSDAGQEPGDDWKHPFPYSCNALQIHE